MSEDRDRTFLDPTVTALDQSEEPGSGPQCSGPKDGHVKERNSMAITKPYKRTVRQLADGSYQRSGNGLYVRHAEYAQSPQHYLRAFQIVQKDLVELFDYVEPADANLSCYSHRILELHARCCFEIEANCTAILRENG